MRITITERHCTIPSRVTTRTETVVGGLTKYEERATAAEVVFSDEKHTKKAEIIVHIDGAPHVVARGEGRDFRSAIDQATDRARRMLRDQRVQRRDHQAPPLSERVSGE